MTAPQPGLPGSIDRYHVLGRLGSGAFATVYLADDPALDATVAIKVLASNLIDDPGVRSRFVDEARLMRRLATPGLVTVFDIGDHEGQPYVVMEHCERGTLATRLSHIGEPLTTAEAMALGRAMASCLQPIHGAGVVHRDLKPSNYLIRRRRDGRGETTGRFLADDEELVVADFGLAKVIDVAATRLSMAGGTPGYSAPEQFRGDPTVDATADVYATSAILVAAITGVAPRPVLGGDVFAFDHRTLAATGPISHELTRALSPDRGVRHRDIMVWWQALKAAATAPDAQATPPPAAATNPGWSPPPAPAPRPSPASPPAAPPPRPVATTAAPPPTPVAAAPPGPAPAAPAPTGTSPTPTGGAKPATFLLTAAVVTLVAALTAVLMVTGVFGLVGADGPAVVGPSRGPVDAAAVFAVIGPGEPTWSIGGEARTGRVVAITPAGPGPVTVAATVDGATTTMRFEAVESPARLSIDGPGHVAVGDDAIELRAVGPPGSQFRWTVNGRPASGEVLAITPTGEPGLVEITLAIDGLGEVARSITVVPSGS